MWGDGARTVLLLPKGGWQGDGPGAVRALRPVARRFVALGWRTITTSYANGSAGLRTVRAAWRTARATCVYGESSGAHWALMLAARDPSARCVIAAAAPTDLATWPRELPAAMRPEAVRLRMAAFGRSAAALHRWSPVQQWPRRDCARVLLLTARNDPIVPGAQARELARRARHAEVVALRAGATPWVHSSVDAGDLERAWGRVRALLGQPALSRC